jgi:hypothetical protein
MSARWLQLDKIYVFIELLFIVIYLFLPIGNRASKGNANQKTNHNIPNLLILHIFDLL